MLISCDAFYLYLGRYSEYSRDALYRKVRIVSRHIYVRKFFNAYAIIKERRGGVSNMRDLLIVCRYPIGLSNGGNELRMLRAAYTIMLFRERRTNIVSYRNNTYDADNMKHYRTPFTE